MAVSVPVRLLFVYILCQAKVFGQTDCSDKPDGVYGIGCRAFEVCQGGNLTVVECQNLVYNDATKQCDEAKNVPPPCGVYQDCTHLKDGSYTDYFTNCTSYYTCVHHHFYGHNFCTPGTVFEQSLSTCVWPVDAYPPCGTKV